MIIPESLKGKVCRTSLSGYSPAGINKMLKEWPGSDVDVIYENGKAIVVAIFASEEDCTMFTLKYGDKFGNK